MGLEKESNSEMIDEMGAAAIFIYRQKVKRILEELVELEKELCIEHKPKLQKINQRIREELM